MARHIEVSPYLRRLTRSEEEARADCQMAKEMHDMIWGGINKRFATSKHGRGWECMDCGHQWYDHSTPERCPDCKCPSPAARVR